MKNVHYSVPDSLVGEKYMSRFIVKKSSSCTGRRKWPLINAVIAVETGASSWSTICVHFPVNRGIAPLCGLAKSTEELRRLYDIHFKEDNRTFVLLLDYARKMDFPERTLSRHARS